MNPTRNHEDAVLILGLTQWVKDPVLTMSCDVGWRHTSDPALLWLWRRPAAVAQSLPLAWELPYAVGAGPKKKKDEKWVWRSCSEEAGKGGWSNIPKDFVHHVCSGEFQLSPQGAFEDSQAGKKHYNV